MSTSEITPNELPVTRRPLWTAGFFGVLATQFLGTFNDNLLRWLSVCVGERIGNLSEPMNAAQEESWKTLMLVLGGVAFTIPYLFLMPLAGSLADRFSKRSVMITMKVAEVIIMTFAVWVMAHGNVTLMFVSVGLMGAQSALFGPSRFGAMPEVLPSEHLSEGNGYTGLATVVACALGAAAGFRMFGVIDHGITATGISWIAFLPAAASLIGIALAGTLTSLLIPPLAAGGPDKTLKLNPLTETIPALKILWKDVRLVRTTFGIAFFWFLASLAQANAEPLGTDVLGISVENVGLLLAVLVAGLGIGSVLAGHLSEGKVELGLVPFGAFGILVSSLLVYITGSMVDPLRAATEPQLSFYLCGGSLFWLGVAAGMFNIPLETYMQYRSDPTQRGIILAACNFITFLFILLSLGVFFFMRSYLHLSPTAIFAVTALGTIPVLIYVLRLIPDLTFRFLLYLISHTFYRLKVHGRENVPEQGGALIVVNHVSFVDGIMMMGACSRIARYIIYADFTRMPILKPFADLMRVIPIKASEGPRALVKSLQAAKEAMLNGELVCIFAEGRITRTGQLQQFQRGMMKIVEGTGCPVIPAYLHGLWGSFFSFRGGKVFGSFPKLSSYPVSVQFGKPIKNPEDANAVRQAVQLLGVEAVERDKTRELIPIRQFIRRCKLDRNRSKVADSLGTDLTGGRVLIAALAMRRYLVREILQPDEKMVGLLIPPSVGGYLANMAIALAGRTAVNLNYTLTDEVLNHCVKDAGLKHVLTTKSFLEKKPIKLEGAEWVFVEEFKTKMTGLDKGVAAVQSYLPSWILDRWLGLNKIKPDDLLTIIFTSGSTGEPKGVMLSQHNIGSNVDGVDQLLNLESTDVLMGVLPFFHSFGYTGTMWLPACCAPKAVYHFNPLDAKIIGKLSEKHKTTIIIATPTFLKTYLKRIDKEQFAHLDMAILGAEKMPLDLAEEFLKKFGVQPSEGYGTTELSPVVSVNIPDHRTVDSHQIGTKLGTIGRPIPGVAAKIVHPDTMEDLGIGKEGLLMIKGPNVMQGYLNQPEKTSAVIKDGWYNTGDYGMIDNEGFISITGRQSRFSKIGGEMVPHILIEDHLTRIVETPDSDDVEVKLAVTSVPDPSRGERLIVLHTRLEKTPNEILNELKGKGLPNLWLPTADSFCLVDQIPILGTGKLDLKGIKETALKQFAP